MMIKAILFDLDDTLLTNPANEFVQHYKKALLPLLTEAFPALTVDKLEAGIINGIRNVIKNCDPLRLNSEVFYSAFQEVTGLSLADHQDLMKTFFEKVHPSLKQVTTPIETAPLVVKWLLDHRFAVAVATNPLFQHRAVEQRLEWACLPIPETGFWFVTSLDNMHYSKPWPHYYEEILTRLGFEPDEAVMVGDDWVNDMVGASQAGLNTFWIRNTHNEGLDIHQESVQPDGEGTLADFFRLITEGNWLQGMTPKPLVPNQIAPRMMGNISALLGMVSEIPTRYWHQRPDPNEWSPMEIVVHLRDSESRVQRPRLERILREDDPFLVPPPSPPRPGEQQLHGLDGTNVALEFAAERAITLELLNGLSAEAWGRPARHSVFGPTNFLEMASFTARHDRLHINQLCQTLGKCE
ncbi:MAG: HAD-IA family hydrolase [Anaerolineae bacterium]|nr:HAD-IA family hydrolase [Anaerolineae bacterium]